jgi:hypothetical protein
VARSTSRFAVLATVAVLASPLSARTQTLIPQPTPESHVIEAKRLLGNIAPSPTGDTGKKIATLQVDFTDFAATYLSGGKSAAKSGTSDAIGTSGTMSTSGADWRSKYAVVERDLTALIGSADPQSPDRGIASLDPTVRKQLQSVRQSLQLFYAAMMGKGGGDPVAQRTSVTPVATLADAVPPPVPAPVPADIDTGTIAALLDRMQSLVDDLSGESGKSGAVGTSGSLSKSGKLEVERQSLDELRSEIAQLKAMLSKGKP